MYIKLWVPIAFQMNLSIWNPTENSTRICSHQVSNATLHFLDVSESLLLNVHWIEFFQALNELFRGIYWVSITDTMFRIAVFVQTDPLVLQFSN